MAHGTQSRFGWAGHGTEFFENEALRRARMRLGMLTMCVFAAFTIVGLRLADISIAVQANVDEPQVTVVEQARHRAELVDRRGNLLARNIEIVSLGADPRDVWDPVDTAQRMLPYLPDTDEDRMVRRLSSGRHFVWLERRISPQQHYDIHSLGLGGVRFITEQRRMYPHSNMLAHLVGYSDVDGEGLSGLELGLNDTLQGEAAPVALSIDLRVQHALRDELAAAMEEFSAIAAAGVVMNVNTGEVLALVSLPDFDPHDPASGSSMARFNQITSGVFELGSVVKPLTIAQALEIDLVNPDTYLDVSQPVRVAGHSIRDFHRIEEPISVWEVLGESSNIGTAQIAGMIGRERQRSFLQEIGFFDQQDIEMPGAAYPLVPSNWGPLETATISFGHGLSVTPLHLTSAIAALVNGGYMIEPTFEPREETDDFARRRVISEETSHQMRALMRYVVTDGTGGNADVPGYDVAGKTGTSEKPAEGGGYDRDRLLSSFVGTFPASDPEIIVFAMLDEPQGQDHTHNFATGGWTVAPTVGRVIERIAPLVGVMPVDMEARSNRAAESQQLATLSPQ